MRADGGDQRAGLGAVHPLELVERERLALRLQVEQLPADHAAGARRASSARARSRRRVVRPSPSARAASAGAARGERHHGEPGRRRRGDAERAVHRRTAAAHVVVVHARQVVVHERVRVHHLDRRRRARARRRCRPRRRTRARNRIAAQPLALAEQAVANRLRDARREPAEVAVAERRRARDRSRARSGRQSTRDVDRLVSHRRSVELEGAVGLLGELPARAPRPSCSYARRVAQVARRPPRTARARVEVDVAPRSSSRDDLLEARQLSRSVIGASSVARASTRRSRASTSPSRSRSVERRRPAANCATDVSVAPSGVARHGVAARERRQRAQRVQPAGDAPRAHAPALDRRAVRGRRRASARPRRRDRAARPSAARRSPRRAARRCAPSVRAISSRDGTAASAAADGVGARRSATRSQSVTSTSWPTAEMVGTGHAGDRARDALVVERPEVFARAAAAADDHESASPQRATRSSAAHELRGAPSPCTAAVHDARARTPGAATAQRPRRYRAAPRRRAGDDGDAARIARERALARGVEQAVGLEPRARLLERLAPQAVALGLDARVTANCISPRAGVHA